MSKAIVSAQEVVKIYGEGKTAVTALKGINLDIVEGDYVCIMGPSGSGKSTCLYVLSTVDMPTKGQVQINGTNVRAMHEAELGLFRHDNLGFIFQEFNLIDALTVKENIAIPLTLAKNKPADIDARVMEIAKKLEISDLLDKFPVECSGGQRQRIASARALVGKPKLIVADEPTGNLDSKNSHELLRIFKELNEKEGITILMVTHDPMIASYSKKLLFLKDGEIETIIERGDRSRKDFYYNIIDVTAKESQMMFENEEN